MPQRLLRVLLVPLLLAGLGFGAQNLAIVVFQRTLDYPGPALGDLPPGQPTVPLSQRVVVVVVDGLREDTSHEMPTFQRLRERGADLPSWTGLPSISRPGYATLGTGAYPEFSGVVTNWYDEPVRVDSVFARAQQAGLRTAMVSDYAGWAILFGPSADLPVTIPRVDDTPAGLAQATETVGQEARRILQQEDVSLLYVHFLEVDDLGHDFGGTSPEYLEAALRVDGQIAALADTLDWSRDTLILTADHGMTARGHAGGGHGGDEPECRRVPVVLVGRGIAPGSYPEGGQADVAPTIAALLGLPLPVHNQGRTRLDALVLSSLQRAEQALSLGEQQGTLYGAFLRCLGARTEVDGLDDAYSAFAAGEYGRVETLVQGYLQRLDTAVSRARANRLWQERFARLPYLILPPLAGLLAFILYRPRRDWLWPLLLTLLFFALHQTLYWLIHGFSFSPSSVGGFDDEKAYFLARAAEAALVMALVAVAAGVLWRRRPWEEVVWRANQSALAIAWTLLCQLGLFLWLYGLVVSWHLPHIEWGFKFFLDLLATVAVGYAGFAFPWLALGVSRLFLLADWGRQRWAQRGRRRP